MFLSPGSLVAVLLVVHNAFAIRIPFQRVRRNTLERRSGMSKVSVLASTTDDDGLSLRSLLAESPYTVQLDTGSSDIWIKGASSPLPNVTDTSTTYNLTYSIGWVFGHIGYGPVQFAGINVPSQALLDVSSANNPALGYGAQGLVGLGFTSLSSIDHEVNKTGASTGRSLLFNLFQDNPSEPNFIAFALQRSTDASDTIEGSFSIGETEPEYSAVLKGPAIPTWPVSSPSRWNVLLEALLVGNTVVTPNTSVVGAPANRAVVLLDSGTSYSYAPPDICQAIYGGVPGAQYNASLGQWTVPCSAEVDIALQFGGQVYPIHPLDMTPTDLGDASICVGSFVPQTLAVGSGEFDWLVGDNVLRSMYSVYDFGDFDSNNKMGNPYVKLLSLVDPNEASKDFHNVRGGAALNNITYNASNTTTIDPSSVVISADISDNLNKIVAFIPAMLGIMALNALVLIVLIVFGVWFMCRKRKTKATTRKTRGRLSPMPMDPRNSYIAGVEPQPHVYQPVSMAITEDMERMRPMSMNPSTDRFTAGVPLADRAAVSMAITEDDMFIPPSPVARTFKGSGLRPADRPSSANYQRQPSMAVEESEDQLFVPPSPGFRSFNGKPTDRPQSAAYQRQPSEDSLIAPARSFDERPRSVGYAHSPSEDSIFVASPTKIANEPVVSNEPAILPPPPQRQAPPPPPSRQAPLPPQRATPTPPSDHPQPERQYSRDSMIQQQRQPSRDSILQPQRQASRDSVHSVRLTDDQFAPGTSSPGPIPRPRQSSNNSSLFVPRDFVPRPGDRPQSFAPADPSTLEPPMPAFHTDGGRPKSMA
ncbi:Acid protease [Mycena venus]|uniref:Acid protease n=1 Tax=Mycena venus TaxID=2733690 RepID=A0A8H6Y6L2_9AGAR|nr:Acid protease [Mycena venus]